MKSSGFMNLNWKTYTFISVRSKRGVGFPFVRNRGDEPHSVSGTYASLPRETTDVFLSHYRVAEPQKSSLFHHLLKPVEIIKPASLNILVE